MTIKEAIEGFKTGNILLSGKEDGVVERNDLSIKALEVLDSNRWVPMEERLPEREEWMGVKGKEHYLRRMEIAVASDNTEYFLVYYDGYKWFDKLGRTYAGIIAWRIHEPFNPQN